MKLLKSFGGEEVEMKVVSLLDSTSSMVSASTWWRITSGGGYWMALGVVGTLVSHLYSMAGASEAIPWSLLLSILGGACPGSKR